MKRTSSLLGAASFITLAALGATPAVAQTQTSAGLQITNTVTMNFQVGGVAQTQQTASDTFNVDGKVSLAVAEVGTTTTQVGPGQAAAVTAFQVMNTSNATLDFALAVAQQAGGAGGARQHRQFRCYQHSNLSRYEWQRRLRRGHQHAGHLPGRDRGRHVAGRVRAGRHTAWPGDGRCGGGDADRDGPRGRRRGHAGRGAHPKRGR